MACPELKKMIVQESIDQEEHSHPMAVGLGNTTLPPVTLLEMDEDDDVDMYSEDVEKEIKTVFFMEDTLSGHLVSLFFNTSN